MAVPFNKPDLQRLRSLLDAIEANSASAEINIWVSDSARHGGNPYVSLEVKTTGLSLAEINPAFGIEPQTQSIIERPEEVPTSPEIE